MVIVENIPVCKPFMPPLEAYVGKMQGIWHRNRVTNNGPLVAELEQELREYLDVPFLHFVTNGTTALQVAIRAMELKGEIITTPFSYVATTTSIIWEQCHPKFVDIDPVSFCLDANKIEEAITKKTSAILATHVYGYACDVEEIQAIAKRHGLKLIYDAAHAFGSDYDGRSLLSFGDVTAVSFHATKLFHTVEGGAVITHDEELAEKMFLMKTFGHREDNFFYPGINGKNSEFHAAMGLCVLPYVKSIVEKRQELWENYFTNLMGAPIQLPILQEGVNYNYAYFPVVFDSEAELIQVKERLEAHKIFSRRYFFPALNTLPYVSGGSYCPIAESLAMRVLCLPLYHELEPGQVEYISSIITETLKQL